MLLSRVMLAIAISVISFSATAQYSDPGVSSRIPELSDLERKMRIYVGLNAMEEISVEELVSMCQAKMWRKEQLEIEDTKFLFESGILEHLFTEVQNETDMGKKGKKIYQVQVLLEQDLVLNSDYAERLINYHDRIKRVCDLYNSEQDRVAPNVLRRELAAYHNLPNTTTLDDLIEKTVAEIVDNGLKMRAGDVDLLLNKKLYRYMCTDDKWKADVLLVGILLLYNADEFNLTISSSNFNIVRGALSDNGLLVSQGMNAMMAQNGKGISTSEVIKKVRHMMTEKCLLKPNK